MVFLDIKHLHCLSLKLKLQTVTRLYIYTQTTLLFNLSPTSVARTLKDSIAAQQQEKLLIIIQWLPVADDHKLICLESFEPYNFHNDKKRKEQTLSLQDKSLQPFWMIYSLESNPSD